MTTYRTIDAGGTELFYREAGDPSAPTLLLLHGFPSSSAQYQQLMELLQDRYHAIAPDYPGFGQSPPLQGAATFDRVADSVDAFCKAKELDRFSLYLFDFGAPVGFRIATRHPGRVQGLVLQNGNAYEAGLGPGMQALKPYWADRAGERGRDPGLPAAGGDPLAVRRRGRRPDDRQPRPVGARSALPRAARSRPGDARPALRLPEQRRAVSALAGVPADPPAAGAAAVGAQRRLLPSRRRARVPRATCPTPSCSCSTPAISRPRHTAHEIAGLIRGFLDAHVGRAVRT